MKPKDKFKIRQKVLMADMDFEEYIAEQEKEIRNLEFVVLLANMDLEDHEEEIADLNSVIDRCYEATQSEVREIIKEHKEGWI